MEIIGIVCEYNPFHNGHIYHIDKIKELYPDSLIILALNGYFLERGEISILTKEDKVNIALDNNVDMVVEIPIIYGTQSADIFADAAISILNNFQVNKIIFGSESNSIIDIKEIANIQLNNKEYDEKVKLYLKEGINYPTALAKALNKPNFNFSSNDLLGISYTKSILKNNFNIDPITIKRTSNFLDTRSFESVISATNIREKLKKNININNFVPSITLNKIININYDNYFKLLKYKIITTNNLNEYLDVDEGIEYRLKKYIIISNNLDEFISHIKTKRYTYNKLNRMFIHILIGLKKTNNNPDLTYTKVLGFNKKAQNYLNSIKDNINIPTIIDHNSIIYEFELKASLIYDLINNTNTYNYELKNKPIIKK